MRLLRIPYEAETVKEFCKVLREHNHKDYSIAFEESLSVGGAWYVWWGIITSKAIVDGREVIFSEKKVLDL